MMKEVQFGPFNTFGFIDNKTAMAKEKVPGIELIPNYQTLNMSGEQFFELITNPNQSIFFIIFPYIDISLSENYCYWYGKVNSVLLQDVQPHDFLWVDKVDKENLG